MVGFDRDEAPGPLVASGDDPCSFYTTKLWTFVQEMLRWWQTWKDARRVADKQRELEERQADLEETRRQWSILNDRLRHYDDARKKIDADIKDMSDRLAECVEKTNASGLA